MTYTFRTPIPLNDLPEIDGLDPDTYPRATGMLVRRNGAAKMKHTGPFELYVKRKGYTDDNNILLDLYDEDTGLSGELQLTPRDAARLGKSLLAHAKAEWNA